MIGTKLKITFVGLVAAAGALLYSIQDDFAVKVLKELASAGAEVQVAGLVITTDCLKQSDLAPCQNFANTDVLYFSGMLPCPKGEGSSLAECIESNDRPLPLVRNALAWELGETEAVVLYGPMPPTPTYFSKELIVYERHVTHIPKMEGYVKPGPGENPPPKTMPNRLVIDASVGDSLNQRHMNTAPSPENPEEELFAIIISGNKVVMEKTAQSLIAGGIPEAAINRMAITDNFVLGSDDKADTFRLIGRIARPFNEEKMAATLSLVNYKFWRVTFPDETTDFTPYPVPGCDSLDFGEGRPPSPCHRSRIAAAPELTEEQHLAYQQLQKQIVEKFGTPNRFITPGYREYSDEFCIETGSYCWGNNNDSLYVNINEKDGRIITFDLSQPDSKIVIVGIDHQAANWADTWNLGFFEPGGVTLGSVGFTDIQKYEYPDIDPALDNLGFYVQLKAQCNDNDEYCYEINFREGQEKLMQIMNRIYLNPQTGTGPAGTQTALPVIYVYQ